MVLWVFVKSRMCRPSECSFNFKVLILQLPQATIALECRPTDEGSSIFLFRERD